MPTPARVAVLPQEQAPLSVEEIALPDPAPHQVVVKQFASGICHSQLHQMHRQRTAPAVLGHESIGVALEVGSEVSHVKEGDKVMVTWVPRNPEEACRPAELVTLQRPDGSTASTSNVFTWADHTIADGMYVVPVPQETDEDVTSIIGCAVITGAGAVYNTAAVKQGDSVAIFGVGGVGLCAVVAAKVVGANPIIAVDLDDEKLEFAKRFGATHGVNASGGDAVEQIRELTPTEELYNARGVRITGGADFAFDCIGRKATMDQILPAARPAGLGATTGGTAVLVGIAQGVPEIDALDLVLHEKKYIGSIGGSCQPDRDFPMFLKWYEDGELDLGALVTERFTIDQINEATTALANGEIFGRAILEFEA